MSAMIKISLPDGSVREVASGTTPADIRLLGEQVRFIVA